jgi:hypothetical protein
MPGAVIPFKANVTSFFVFLVVISLFNWLLVAGCRMLTKCKISRAAWGLQLVGVKDKPQNLLRGLFQARKAVLADISVEQSEDALVGASSGTDMNPVQSGESCHPARTIAYRRGRSRDQSPAI